MQKYREILKLTLKNTLSCNEIAKARGCSHNTVRRAKELTETAGITLDNLETLSDSELREILYPNKRNAEYIYPDIDAELAFIEKGYNLSEAHARYVEEVGFPAALKYSAYCYRIREHRKGLSLEFRHNHIPAFAMQIDYAGYRPKGLEDDASVKFELFVAVMPASQYIFATVVRSQSTQDTIEASIKAFEFYGGVSETIVSDNLKAVVLQRPKKTDPVLNPKYLAFADYYGTRVAPTRVRRPKDKASVEVAVKLIQRVLRLRLASQPLMTMNEINLVLKTLVKELNNRPMKRGGETRTQRYERIDSPDMLCLPPERMTYTNHPKALQVPPNYHVRFESASYSVPHQIIGKRVTVRYSSNSIEIRHDGLVVALHERTYTKDEFVTSAAHRPINHQQYIEYNFSEWLCSLPENLQTIVIEQQENTRDSSQRTIERILRLKRTYGLSRLEKACAKAASNGSANLRHVTNLLQNNLEEQETHSRSEDEKFSPRRNLRGQKYFEKDLKIDGERDDEN